MFPFINFTPKNKLIYFITSCPELISLLKTVYFCMIPLVRVGLLQDTITEFSPLVTALISDGALGTEIEDSLMISWEYLMFTTFNMIL